MDRTPLLCACYGGSLELVRWLIETVRVEVMDAFTKVRRVYDPRVCFVRANGVVLWFSRQHLTTPFLEAVAGNSMDVAQWLFATFGTMCTQGRNHVRSVHAHEHTHRRVLSARAQTVAACVLVRVVARRLTAVKLLPSRAAPATGCLLAGLSEMPACQWTRTSLVAGRRCTKRVPRATSTFCGG